MSSAGPPPPPARYIVPIDDKYYNLDEEERAFFKQQTGIEDDAALKEHIVAVQAAAYAIYQYPCIRRFAFTLKIARLFPYKDLLKLGRERDGAIFLDIGCCFGNDVRKAIADGYPIENAIASDLQQGFWDLGHKLFKTTPETFPVPFIAGDVFDDAHLALVPPFTAANPPTTARPDLKTLTSLNPLRGHVSAIHASALFHLFQEPEQLALARRLAGLLSPAPGALIFGQHGALPKKGFRAEVKQGQTMFCHSPESWTALWDGEVFEKGTVEVRTELREVDSFFPGIPPEFKFYMMTWSVTRL